MRSQFHAHWCANKINGLPVNCFTPICRLGARGELSAQSRVFGGTKNIGGEVMKNVIMHPTEQKRQARKKLVKVANKLSRALDQLLPNATVYSYYGGDCAPAKRSKTEMSIISSTRKVWTWRIVVRGVKLCPERGSHGHPQTETISWVA